MKRIKVRCARCGKSLFFLLPKGSNKGSPTIEIKCYKDRCKAINIVNYQDPGNLVVTLKE